MLLMPRAEVLCPGSAREEVSHLDKGLWEPAPPWIPPHARPCSSPIADSPECGLLYVHGQSSLTHSSAKGSRRAQTMGISQSTRESCSIRGCCLRHSSSPCFSAFHRWSPHSPSSALSAAPAFSGCPFPPTFQLVEFPIREPAGRRCCAVLCIPG